MWWAMGLCAHCRGWQGWGGYGLGAWLGALVEEFEGRGAPGGIPKPQPSGMCLHGSERAPHPGPHCNCLSVFVLAFGFSHPITNHTCYHLLSTYCVQFLG